MRRLLPVVAHCAAIIAVAISPVLAEGRQAFAVAYGPSLTQPPSRLGLRDQQWRLPRTQDHALPRAAENRCRRWRLMAGQLGETYAGYKLRRGVVKKICGRVDDSAPRVWGWPWTGLASGQVLPPRTVQISGTWQVRCGRGPWRRRCAAIQSGLAPLKPAPDPGAPVVVTHFVIDTIAGRESLLWRVFIAEEAGQAANRQRGGAATATPARQVRYRLGGQVFSSAFATCATMGCVVETGPQRAGDVASALLDGRSIEFEALMPSGKVVTFDIPAGGFRSALHELMRLRRIERAALYR